MRVPTTHTHDLQSLFNRLVGTLPPVPVINDVAFPLPGGLEGAAAAFNGDIEADIYARPHNPTVRALADAVTRLDGGIGAVAYASGQAAIRNVFQLLTAPQTEIILSRHVFGGTAALEGGALGRTGVTFRWADATDADSFAGQVNERTRAIFVEGVANPGGDVADFKGLRALAHSHAIPFIVDNTTAPLLLRPIDHGADIVVYSATKYLNGFGDAAAGIVVDAGRFDWKGDTRYRTLSAGIGGAPSLAQRFGQRALLKGLQSQLTVDGAILSPDKAATIYGNLATLPARLDGHIRNTHEAATLLAAHDAVERVHYAGLETDPSHARAKTYLPHGVTGPILVTLKGGRTAAAKFIDALGDAFLHAVNIGDSTRNLVSHPQTTTHRQFGPAHREALGIHDGSLRLSLAAGDNEKARNSLSRALALL